jgi:2-methylisocitrate lyase-like PEP mutase family enzyme
VFAHVREVTQATALPLSVDLENGYGVEPERAASALVRAAEAGAVGGSIEDWDRETGIYPRAWAVERIAAACEAAHALGFPFIVTARAENLIRGNPDLDDTIARLVAYEQAGADVLFAPGLRDGDQIRTVCAAVSKPVNVLAHAELTMREIVDAGAQRVSVGGALTWTAVSAFIAAAERLRDEGDFSVLGSSARIQELISRSPALGTPGS